MPLQDIAGRLRTAYDELKGIESLEERPEAGQVRKALVQLRDAVTELQYDPDFLAKMANFVPPQEREGFASSWIASTKRLTASIGLAQLHDQVGGDTRTAITTIMTTHLLPNLVQIVEGLARA